MSDPLAMAIIGQASPAATRTFVGVVTVKADAEGVTKVRTRSQEVEAVSLTSAATANVGESVLLLRSGAGLWVIGKIGQPPTPPPPDPDEDEPDEPEVPPRSTYETKTVTFRPQYTGSYRGGWRTDTTKVYTGDWTGRGVNLGRAFYGSGPSGLKKVEQVEWAEVRLERVQGGVFASQTLPMVLIGQKTRPSGSGSVQRSTSGPSLAVGQSATWRMPQAWADDLVSGAAGGLGIGSGSSSPYIATNGKSDSASAWTLRIRYTYRTS